MFFLMRQITLVFNLLFNPIFGLLVKCSLAKRNAAFVCSNQLSPHNKQKHDKVKLDLDYFLLFCKMEALKLEHSKNRS